MVTEEMKLLELNTDNGHTLALMSSFLKQHTDNYIWTDASQTENYKELFTNGESCCSCR